MYNKIKYIPINCEIACNKLKRSMPYKWDLNIYRGCEHGCKYCYAIYSHKYINSNNYFEEIYVKTNIVEKLERQLKSSKWKKEVINIGGVTDSYQPIEADYKIMPEILNLLIKYKTPAIISTKSDLILRDYDLIDKLSRITYINVASTITTVNEDTQRLIEPNGVDSMRRFKMLKEFRKTNASVGLHIMPIIPYITDDFDNINSLFRHAKECNVHYVLSGTLYLRGITRGVFFDFVKKEFPELFDKLSILYSAGSLNREYKNQLYKMVNELRYKYSLSSSYSKIMKEKLKNSGDVQISFFD
ncbi:radical SAM protein [Clostridioides difficile]|uniref:SPL family radical SAM protein n=1 Tax=Clostridioides difficile TaxID=1496 RepID=UPI001FAC77C9|nr:radical SAM protein [Clostridioides difficile]MCJ0225126.1 radical SAM protein [Clostridioides difficile]MCJ0428334.1 radical SAM protein [Clostridioides difficile]MCJ0436440.1 radical SAM protein [Clostridioides difficile]MCU6149514.1 radical SAM protein [Clostridioides difficile]